MSKIESKQDIWMNLPVFWPGVRFKDTHTWNTKYNWLIKYQKQTYVLSNNHLYGDLARLKNVIKELWIELATAPS